MTLHVWPDPNSNGWVDAWNGWYETLEQALRDSSPAVAEGRPWVLRYGEGLVDDDQMEERSDPPDGWVIMHSRATDQLLFGPFTLDEIDEFLKENPQVTPYARPMWRTVRWDRRG